MIKFGDIVCCDGLLTGYLILLQYMITEYQIVCLNSQREVHRNMTILAVINNGIEWRQILAVLSGKLSNAYLFPMHCK